MFLTDYVKVWVHPDDRERVRQKTSVEYIKKALENNQTYYLNYRCIQNGETQYIQLRIVNVGNRERVSQISHGLSQRGRRSFTANEAETTSRSRAQQRKDCRGRKKHFSVQHVARHCAPRSTRFSATSRSPKRTRIKANPRALILTR